MMTRFKDFGSGAANEIKEPLSFKLFDEEFHCIPQIQGKTLLKIIGNSSLDDPIKSSQTVVEFFETVLVDESLTRFNDLIESKDKIVSVETLSEIVAWLMEEYTDRPEQQPED